MKTLAITSPLIQGNDVKHAQHLLTSNMFKQDYMQGGVQDGAFGPETGRACIRAKYWLGYSTRNQKPIFGDELASYLDGSKKLPLLNTNLRVIRLAEKQKKDSEKTLGQKALERAYKDEGMKENPSGSNRCPISERWGVIGPWCDMSVSEWYIDVGSKAFKLKENWAYVPYMLAAAEQGKDGIWIVRWNNLKPGDIWCADWDQDGVADHTGLFIEKTSETTFKAIEGNTAVGNDSNGGEVMIRDDRYLSNVAKYNKLPAFIHVGK